MKQKTIVVKAGTNLLTDKNGELDLSRMSKIAADISKLRSLGAKPVIVTSGAIGAGMGKMGIKTRPSSLTEKQALAAIGQPLLMDAYNNIFGRLGIPTAQVLLTRQDFSDRTKYNNAKNTLLTLLKMDVVPIINENDTVAVEEINFGDNDTLSALVSSAISASWLVILTDVAGLYKGVPGKSELVRVVESINDEIRSFASSKSESGKGTGGMSTKLSAANIASCSGVTTIITDGREDGVLTKIFNGENPGTVFLPKKALLARKHWIAFGPKCFGTLIIDEGAAKALLSGNKSLLPSGITACEGSFAAGDTVSITGPDRKEIGRGISNYSLKETEKIKGKKTQEIKKLLQNFKTEEVVHRDNLVIL